MGEDMKVYFMFSKKYAISLCVLVLIASIFLSAFSQSRVKVGAENEAERSGYLLKLGYECSEPVAIKEVNIPAEFDGNFEKLNAVVKKSGFDLSVYKGETVELYTYLYDKHKQINMFVYKGYLIGSYITDLQNVQIYPLQKVS